MSATSVFLACLTALGIVLALPDLTVACTCGEVPPAEAFARADAAFVGIATDLQAAPPVRELGPGPGSFTMVSGARATRFLVQEAFLGVAGKEVFLYETGTTCDIGFNKGETYLVYAYRAADGRLYTNFCSRTAPVTKAKSDLAYLRRVKSRSEPGIVTGRVIRFRYDQRRHEIDSVPRRNVKVVFSSSEKTVMARTDGRGQFTIRGLPKGDYRVWTEPRTNTSSLGEWDEHGRTEWHAELPGHGTVSLWFGTEPTARVAGRVVDDAGRGVPHVDIELATVDRRAAKSKDRSGWTDQDGLFTFEALLPGDYLLGFNVYNDPSLDDPYPRHLFPGVGELGNATRITIAEGASTGGFELRIPPKLREVPVTGIAFWPDGTTAGNTYITIRHPRTGFQEGNSVTTDDAGRFSITGLEGVTYYLSAFVNDGIPLVNSVPIEVTPGVTTEPVRLLITLPKR